MIDVKELANLNLRLRDSGYEFVCPTPETHRRVLEKNYEDSPVREFFGWSKAVPADKIPSEILLTAKKAGIVRGESAPRSCVRFSSLDGLLYAHSSYPTIEEDSVFFGPDSYRFVRFLKEKVQSARFIVDIGCGSGVGAVALARSLKKKPERIVLSDINSQALSFAEANAKANEIKAEVIKSDLLTNVPSGADLIIANPPFIMDDKSRAYRDGGDNFASDLSVKIVERSLDYLPEGGTLALYSGASIVRGKDILKERLTKALKGIEFTYEEIDPDIFGEEISLKPYREVERIASIGLIARK